MACLAGAAGAQAPADPLAPFGWLRQLAGSCWRGEYANTRTADKQCYEWQYGRFLRGTIELTGVQGEGVTPMDLRGDSVWAWDAARSRLQLTTWASNGTLSPGEAVFDGDVLRVTMGRGESARDDAHDLAAARRRCLSGAPRAPRRRDLARSPGGALRAREVARREPPIA